MRVLAVVALCGAIVAGQQSVPRDQGGRPQRRVGSGVIRGRVVAADTGAPLRRALVSVYGSGDAPFGATATTDRDGRFTVDKVPPDTYQVSVQPYRRHTQYLRRPFPGVPAAGAPVVIEMREGETVGPLQIVLARAGAIAGRVVDENGDPLSDILVQPVRFRGTPQNTRWGTTQSDERGRFRLFALAPGDYYVLAKGDSGVADGPDGDSAFVDTYAPGTTSRNEAAVIHVDPATEATADIQLVRGRLFRISGMVLDSQGRPVTNGQVSLHEYSTDGETATSTWVDGQGRFTLPRKSPGRYILSARTATSDGMLGEYVKVPVTLLDADLADLIVTTKPSATVSGRVVFAESAPASLPPVTIQLVAPDRTMAPENSNWLEATVGRDLSFTIPRVFGDVVLRASRLPNGWHLQRVMLGDQDVTDVAREFTPQDAGRLQVVLSSRMSSIEGRILDAERSSLAGNAVFLLPEDRALWRATSRRFGYTYSDPSGRFRMRGVSPGRYLIVAVSGGQAVGYQTAGPEFFEPFVREATPILVGEDEVRSIDLRLSRGQ